MKTILAIPGLGGHTSVYNYYTELFPDYTFRSIEFINLKKTEQEITSILEKEKEVIVLANCYGVLPILRSRYTEGRIEKLIIIEPFFSELYWWKPLALCLGQTLFFLSRLTDAIGLRRRSFKKKDLDYVYLARYPLLFQPLFDLLHQNTTDYLEKILDILTFQLPDSVLVPTLIIFSPDGYSTDPKKRQKMISHFKDVSVVEVSKRTHNIVTVSDQEIVSAIKHWLSST